MDAWARVGWWDNVVGGLVWFCGLALVGGLACVVGLLLVGAQVWFCGLAWAAGLVCVVGLV